MKVSFFALRWLAGGWLVVGWCLADVWLVFGWWIELDARYAWVAGLGCGMSMIEGSLKKGRVGLCMFLVGWRDGGIGG